MVGFFGQCADTGRRSVDRGRLTEQNVARGRFDEKVMHVSGSNRSNADGLYGCRSSMRCIYASCGLKDFFGNPRRIFRRYRTAENSFQR